METLEKIPYKGYSIHIYQDENYQSPDDWGDENIFLVAFHRDFTVERKDFAHELCESITRNGKYEDDSINHEAKQAIKDYHVFGLEAYIHSGVSLALSKEGNFPDRQWDVSQLGLVFVSKKETRYTAKARKMALSLIKEWNDTLSGNVYGYTIGKDEDEFGGRWGFSGDYAKSGLLESAKEEIDSEIADRMKKHAQRLKSMITAHVPLDKRVACNA